MRFARLAVPAFLFVLGLVGAASASAVTLCEENIAVCAGKGYPVGTEVQAEQAAGTKFQIVGGTGAFPGVECNKSNIQFKTTENRGPEKILVASFTVLNAWECTGCASVTAVNLPYTDEITWNALAQGNGFMSISSGGKGNFSLSLKKCGMMSIDCTFGSIGFLYGVIGRNPATVLSTNEAVTREAGNLLCGKTAEVTSTYTVTAPGKMWVEKSP